MFLRFGYEKLSRALRKIFSLAMPQILLPYVNFATMLQRYGFFMISPKLLAIILHIFLILYSFNLLISQVWQSEPALLHFCAFADLTLRFWDLFKRGLYYIYYNILIYNNKYIFCISFHLLFIYLIQGLCTFEKH